MFTEKNMVDLLSKTDTNIMGNKEMPAKSAKQQRFMGMCSNKKGRAKAHGKCPPMKVAKEYAKKPVKKGRTGR